MKTILFFVVMILCGINFAEAEPLAQVICTDNNVSHTYQTDSEDRDILYVDGEVYNFIQDSTEGDINLSKYAKDNDPTQLAYISVEYDDDENQIVKLVLMKSGAKETTFGALCAFE